jgi:hypothetical protein
MPFEATIKWIRKETRDTLTCALKINNRDIQESVSVFPDSSTCSTSQGSERSLFP